ncbi:hypothetical protein CBR_g41703 [Chara braunii]|uniref:Uncharacterized protein n=1 Tax=Chara braunii TaxID=69332 RepID=A0A388LWD3_CHABU|nr:hypothetical protein CBR_g41703 [Chara braunii]|eukprot:GBG86640.1 hypothetical protein CBR_g41703 [Chara braunii]
MICPWTSSCAVTRSRKRPSSLDTRTLTPLLLWSTCTDLDKDNCRYPSQGKYLVIDATDLSVWDPLIRRVNVGETSEEAREEKEGEEAVVEEVQEDDHLQYSEGQETLEEEESKSGSDDPDYHGSEDVESVEADSGEEDVESKDSGSRREDSEEGKGGSGESSGPAELNKEEEEVVAQRRQDAAEGKRSIEESERPPSKLLQGDPMLNPEPPREEIERDGGAATEGSGSRRRRRSESPTQSSPPSRTTVRLRRDAGAQALSPIIISSSP